ncbi:Putative F-box protein [Morus notabilis]|uniref:Putative F-box protein n=1 Tax=Morus notabilis TaxID=981085 RepID=W9R398_9ROSA|nr:putative F-box protein At1g65770 [Morus notabilis]EXB37361.1 Putative F-box protein [Morus notabilis]
MADWSGLPLDILLSIAKRLSFEDLVAFGAVCTSWRPAATKENFDYSRQQIPWLMLFSSDVKPLAKFHSLSSEKTFDQLPHPREVYNQKLIYSSSGWIMSIDDSPREGAMSLFHPLSQAQIRLPRQSFVYVNRFALSASPSETNSDYIVIVIFHQWLKVAGHLALWKPGNSSWTLMTDESILVSDVAYHKGRFYAVDTRSRVLVLNIDQDDFNTVVVKEVMFLIKPVCETCLVESKESLLIVRDLTGHVRVSARCRETIGFEVYEVNIGDGTFVKVKNLGDRALFLGYQSSSFCVKASDFEGCRANCIYFIDGVTRKCNIYTSTNADDGNFESKYEGISQFQCFGDECRNIYPPTLLWLQPTF